VGGKKPIESVSGRFCRGILVGASDDGGNGLSGRRARGVVGQIKVETVTGLGGCEKISIGKFGRNKGTAAKARLAASVGCLGQGPQLRISTPRSAMYRLNAGTAKIPIWMRII